MDQTYELQGRDHHILLVQSIVLILIINYKQTIMEVNHQAQIAQQVKSIMKWKEEPSDIIVERMTGITNETYKVSTNSPSTSPVIYRKFGQSTENIFLERNAEAFIYQHISQVGVGPKIYHYGDNIRIEQFIQSSVLPAAKMLEQGYLQKVAFALNKFHSLKPEAQVISSKSMVRRVFGQMGQLLVQKCHAKLAKDIYSEEEKQLLGKFRKWISKEEIQYLLDVTEPLEGQGLVFSHNDALANNVLIKADSKEFLLIDYEYACYSYPIFDIANYFNEAMIDYETPVSPFFSILPPQPHHPLMKIKFMEAYVVASKHNSVQSFLKQLPQTSQEGWVQERVKQLNQQLDIGTMMSHLMWGWWGVLVGKNSLIDFDYIKFSTWRLEEYTAIKNKLKKNV